MRQGPVESPLVAARQPAQDAPLPALLRVLQVALGEAAAGPQEEAGQNRREEDREEQRGEQGRDQGEGERAEEYGRDAAQEDEGSEDGDRRQGRADERRRELPDRALGRFLRRLAEGEMQHDVLHDHDGVVDDHPDGRGEAAEGHQIEAHVEEAEEHDGDQDRDGNDKGRHHGRAPVLEEAQEHGHREGQADEDALRDARNGVPDEDGLVVEDLELDVGRKGLPDRDEFRG